MLLGSFWSGARGSYGSWRAFWGSQAATDQLLGTIKARGQPLASPSLVIVWSPASTFLLSSYLDTLITIQVVMERKCDV